MGFSKDFINELNKRNIRVQNNTTSTTTQKKKKKGKNTFEDDLISELNRRNIRLYNDDDIAPVRPTVGTFSAPMMAQPTKDDSKFDFFQRGAFDDGYDFGDVSATILGTAGDLGLSLVKGVGRLGEGIGDAINYGIAGAADFFGADDFAETLRKETQKNLVDDMSSGATDFLDDYSVSGETLDSVAEGVGYMAGIMATGGLGQAAGLGAAGVSALTTGTTFVSGLGSGMSEAYQGGATDDEALKYGLISGSAEAISELLFGGLGKGVNALGIGRGLSSIDDMLAKKISQKFTSQIAKNFVQFGIKSSAEGLEEVISGVAQAIGKWKTYKSEEDIWKILKDENLLEQFVVGTVTSGFMQSGIVPATRQGSLIESNKNSTDFITGLSSNEQLVVDKVYKDAIAEAEKDGKKLSSREKSKLYDKVIEQLEKGEIKVDTIESVLGGETYEKYKAEGEKEDAILSEFKELGKKVAEGKATDEEHLRYKKLGDTVEGFTSDTERSKLRQQLDNEMMGAIKGSRLTTSYTERAKRGETFEADLSQYDEKQQAIVKKAVESGVLNNTRRTHEFVDLVAKICADKGLDFDFFNNEKIKGTRFAVEGRIVNGYRDGNTIGINIQSNNALQTVVGHEVTHVLEGTELYDVLQNMAIEFSKTKGDYGDRMIALRELYTGKYKSDADGDFEAKLRQELTADIVGEYLFTDSEFINRLSTEQPSLFKKIFDEIKYLCRVATAGSKEARELEKVKKAFETAYREGGKAQKNTTNEGSVEYSLGEVKIPTRQELESKAPLKVVDISKPQTQGNFSKRRKAILSNVEEVISKPYYNKDTGVMIFLTKKSYTHAFNNMGNVQLNAVEHLPELIENAILTHREDVTHGNEYATGIYTFFAAAKSNSVLPVKLKVKEYAYLGQDLPKNIKAYFENSPQGFASSYDTVVLEVEEIEKSPFASVKDMNQNDSFLDTNELSTIKVADFLNLVKGDAEKYVPQQYSLSTDSDIAPVKETSSEDGVFFDGKKPEYSLSTDSKGRALSKEQGKYFKDSKIRDANGNLRVMYHGSQESFTVFDKKKARSGGTYGSGFYFTDSESHAGTYGDSYEVFLNVTNPLQNGTNDITKDQLRRFVEAIAEDEDYGIENYGYGATIDSVVDSVYGKSDFGMLMDLNISCVGDMVAAVELFNEVNGTSYDGIVAPTETVVFYPNQIKSVDNKTPTKNPDIRYSLSAETDIYSRISDLQLEVGQISRTLMDIESSDEFKEEQRKISEAFTEDTDKGIALYMKWSKESEYGKLKTKKDALEAELDKLRAERDNANATEALDEEKRAIAKSGLSEAEYFRKQAVNEFGYTPFFYDAGYITPNGKMLNFSGEKGKHYGSRGEDHRAIGIIYAETQGTEALVRFMNDGNVRIMAESPGVDISAVVEPTKEQYSTIRKFIYEYIDREYFNVDFSDESGKVIGSLEYENRINPTRILNDIKHFYATGEIRGQNDIEKYRYSLSMEDSAPTRKFGLTYGEDVMLEKAEDIAPVRADVARKPLSDIPIDYAPMTEDEANAMVEEQNNVAFTDDDVPPIKEAPIYDDELEVPIDDATTKGIVQRVRETLSLNASEAKGVQALVQRYGTTGLPTREQVFEDVKNEFGEKRWKERNDEISVAKQTLRGFKIKVSDIIKRDIPDFSEWRKRHQGRLNFSSKDGLSVDDIYMSMSYAYPHLFPADIINPTDQLLKMAEIMDEETYISASREVDSDAIQEAADIIFDEVSRYRESSQLQSLAEDQSYFFKEVIANDDLAGKREQLNEWYEKKKARLHEELDDKDAYISKRAMGFYNELNGLKKGVRASEELGYFLDFGFKWSELKSTFLQVSKWPHEVIRPDSAAESIVREAIGREYEDRLYDFDDLDTEYRKRVEALEKPTKASITTVKERVSAKLESTRRELVAVQQLRDDSNADFDSEISRLEAEYNAKRDKNTKTANNLLRRIENLKRMMVSVDADYSKRISDLEARVEKMESPQYQTAEQRKSKQQEYSEQMAELIGDTTYWKDKKMGISYKINTLRRNLRDIVRDDTGKRDIAKADAIYDELQGKYNHNEAELNRESSRIKQPYGDMKITNEESTYIQMLGELRHNPDTTLTEDVVKAYYEEHKDKIDAAKVDKVIEMARKTFDDLLVRVNKVLSEQGMKEIPYRKGYFPHFTEEKQSFLAKLFNWKTQNNDIPTDIAGLTENFNPNRSWQSFNKQRKGDTTDYNFLKGLDTYVQGSLDWIYHIEDIQKRRAFENHIRYVHSEKGIQEKIDAIRNNDEYDADEAQEQIELVYKEAGNPLNNFVTDFRTGTNTLAGKKSSIDRTVEEMTNRKFYSTMTNISNRVTGNMVAGSVSSALTNFIPITQSWGQVNPVSSLRAMGDTIRAHFRDDGVVDKSDFLTNRLRKADNLYKSNWDKVGEIATILMEAIDSFTSQTVWRSKYLENISKGMSESEAIKNADQFSENVLAGRSRGNQPTIFDSKNPLIKAFTAFQLEVNNQYGYMFKDMPQDMQNESKAKLVKGYVAMFVGAYVYNALYSSLTGRNAAFDPVRIIVDLLADIFGGDDEDEEEIAPSKVIMNFADDVLEEMPFVGSMVGGGRIPLSSAMPYGEGVYEMVKGTLEDVENGDVKSLTNEWLNPLFYLGAPIGGGQIRKTAQGLSMFSKKNAVAGVTGSYTDGGDLRFPVEDTLGNRVKAGVFGQYAFDNAREYFDNDYAPLKEKQIKEYADVDLPIADYWKYREGLKKYEKQDDKVAYINGLDVSEEQKNTLKSYLYDEEGYKAENPEKYAFLESEGIGFLGYKELDEETQESWSWAFKHQDEYRHLKANGVYPEDYSVYRVPMLDFDDEDNEAYEWAFDNPEKATLGKVFGSGVKEYRQYTSDLSSIRADKDSKGNSINGSAKAKKKKYIFSLDIDDGAKYILYRSQFPKDDTYNNELVGYLLSRDDISYADKKAILEELNFKIDSNGRIRW